MPNRTTADESEKLDHSSHPTTHATKDDLRAPGGGTGEPSKDKAGSRRPTSQSDTSAPPNEKESA